MLFLTLNQQCQSTEGNGKELYNGRKMVLIVVAVLMMRGGEA